MLRSAEAARLLGIGRTKLYELLGSGALALVRIGVSRRVLRESLQMYIAAMSSAQSRPTARHAGRDQVPGGHVGRRGWGFGGSAG